MKFIRLCIIAAVLFAAFAVKTFAQAPSSQFGIGVGTSGGEVVYALSSSLQIGSGIGLGLGDGATNISISPFVRFLLEGSKGVHPFLEAGVGINSSTLNGASVSNNGIFGDFGLVYYAAKNVGILGGVNIVNISLETGGPKRFGILSGFAGVEMWF